MNKRLWVLFAALVVATFGGLIWYKNSTSTEEQAKLAYVEKLDETKLVTKQDVIKAMEETTGAPLSDEAKSQIVGDHHVGPTDAKVVVIEYEDFACSHCQAFHMYAEQIQEDYQDDVLFIFRDFSLSYPNSAATLTAAEAVKRLGGDDAFWAMSKLLFSDDKWIYSTAPANRDGILEDYAKQAGVNVDDFNDLRRNAQDNGIQAKIDRDKALGEKAGVNGTPTWFVNGQRVEEISDDGIRKAIEKALNAADGQDS